jgi:murein DD-endopeptidase MepM/ murein hydrolase activator NlpD
MMPTMLQLSAPARRGSAAVLLSMCLLAFPPLATPSSAAQVTTLTPSATASDAAVPYRWPLDGEAEVVRSFEPPVRRWHPGHRGVDLAARPEVVVRAAGPGVVRFAGPVVDRTVVSIDHPDGLRTTYEPLTPMVAAGDRVAAGDPIGVVVPGHGGCPREACLHWGVRHDHHYLDPLALLGLGRVRLLPVAVSHPEG